MVEPRGRVMRVAGRDVHVRGHEGSEPAVVLMNGCGLAMEYWRFVNERLGDVRVLAYDRPGLGGTRWPGHVPTLAEEVRSLAALLEQEQIGRAVLVAHSQASFHAEALALLRPELVGAIVMVDGSIEDYDSKPRRTLHAFPRYLSRTIEMLRLRRLGGLVWRLGVWYQSDLAFSRLGYGRLDSIYRDHDALAMATAESIGYARQGWDLQQLRARHPWPERPVMVLTAGRNGRWIQRQARWARRLGGQQLVVARSKHLMMLDCPEVIVDAVRQVREAMAGATDATPQVLEAHTTNEEKQ